MDKRSYYPVQEYQPTLFASNSLLGQVLDPHHQDLPADLKQRLQSQYEILEIKENLPDNIGVAVNETVKVQCQLYEPVEPSPVKAIWLKNGRPIISQDQPRYQTAFNEQLVATLLLIDSVEDDSGVYSCVFSTETGATVRTNCEIFICDASELENDDENSIGIQKVENTNSIASGSVSSVHDFEGAPRLNTQKHVKFQSMPEIYQESKELSDEDLEGYYPIWVTENGSAIFHVFGMNLSGELHWQKTTGLQVEHIKNDTNIKENNPNRKFFIRVDKPKENCIMVVFKCTDDDAGLYSCTAENGSTVRFVLNVIESSKLLRPIRCQPPKIVKKPEERIDNITAGDDVRVTCVVTGYPPPLIVWCKHRTVLDNQNNAREALPHFQYKEYGNNASLMINECRWFDTGVYHCRVVNALGEQTVSMELIVSDTDSQGNALAQTGTEDSVPVFMQRFSTQNVLLNQVAEFGCLVAGNPTPEVCWSFDGTVIVPSKHNNKYTIQANPNGHHCLSIEDVKKQDAGKIVCEVNNSNGKAYCAAFLKIKKDKKEKARLPTMQEIDDARSSFSEGCGLEGDQSLDKAPHFIYLPAQLELDHGKDAILRCQIQANPRALITWLKDGKRLNPDNLNLLYDENCQNDAENQVTITRSRLKLKSVSAKDTGIYICTAENRSGEVSCAVPVEVTSLADIQAKAGLSPEIALAGSTQSIRLVKLTAGKTARITLSIHGMPLPDVTWHKNGTRVYAGNRISILKELSKAKPDRECSYILKIARVKKADEGLYTILAQNPYGLTKTMVDIIVKDPNWRDLFEIIPENTMAFEGTDVTLNCRTKRIAEIVWRKKDQDIEAMMNPDQYKITSDGRDHTLTLYNISQEDAAKYWACLGNVRVGANVDIAESLVSTQISSQPEPLMIISRPGVKYVDIPNRGTLVLQYKLNYDDIPVEWKLNGMVLEHNNRSRIKSKGDLHTLILCNVTKDDNGFVDFSCGKEEDQKGRVNFECILPPKPAPEIRAEMVGEKEAVIKWDYDPEDQVDEVLIESKINVKSDWERVIVLPPTLKEFAIEKPRGNQYRIAFSNTAGQSEWKEVFVPTTQEVFIVRPLKDINIQRGEPIHVAVELSMDLPESAVEWKMNGAVVTPAQTNIQLDHIQQIRSLTIPKFLEVGNIHVSFKAQKEGMEPVYSDCTIKVQERPIKMIAELESQSINSSGSPVFMMNLLEPLQEGETVQWKIDGRSVMKDNDNFEVKIKNKKSFNLLVKDLSGFNEKSMVTFEALGHGERFATSTADLNIRFPEPEFLKPLKSEYNLLIGETAKIDVHVDNLSKSAVVEWFHNGTKISDTKISETQRFVPAFHENVMRLTMKTLLESDAGPIEIQITSNKKKISSKSVLILKKPPPAMELTQPSTKITSMKPMEPPNPMQEGQGDVSPTKSKKPFEINDSELKPGNNNLKEAGMDMTGMAGATFKQPNTEMITAETPGAFSDISKKHAKSEQDISVKKTKTAPAVPKERTHFEVLSQVPDEAITCEDGEKTIVLTANLSAEPKRVCWTLNNEPITSSDPDFKMLSFEGKQSLIIREMSHKRSGEYVCQVPGSECKAKFNLTIAPPAEIKRSSDDIDGAFLMSHIPRAESTVSIDDLGKFKKGLPAITEVDIGTAQTVLTCEVNSSTTKAMWFKDGQPIMGNNRIKAVRSGKLRKLKIERPCLEDVGVYMCETLEDATETKLTVIEPVFEVEKSRFFNGSGAVEFCVGDTLSADFELNKLPAKESDLSVEWRLGDEILKNGGLANRVKISKFKNSYNMEMKNLSLKEDHGEGC